MTAVKRKRRIRAKKRPIKGLFFIVLTIFSLLVIMFVSIMDRRLLPTVMRIEEYRMDARLNEAINTSLALLAYDRRLVSEDFYTAVRGADGRIKSLSANTVLINDITVDLSRSLVVLLAQPVSERVNVPIGTLLGVQWLANIGPSYSVRILPLGTANVEYHTSFTGAGINQVNFQVWLTISANMQIVNPMQEREVLVSRSVPLVNTVFAGEIPDVYLSPIGGN